MAGLPPPGLGASLSDRRRFAATLAALAALALGLRLGYGWLDHLPRGFSDDVWFHLMANSLAHGHGFNVTVAPGRTAPTMFRPPLFPLVLAVGAKLGLTSYGAQRAIGCALGAATVTVAGLIGDRLGGRLLGVATAAAAAVYLPLLANDSILMSESLYALLIALSIFASLALIDRPSRLRAAALGAAIGLATLTRSEAILLIAMIPLVARRARVRPWLHTGVAFAAVAVLVAPWCIRNSLVFHRLTGVSNGDGAVLAEANTHRAYYGPLVGSWTLDGLNVRPLAGRDRYNEAAGSAHLRTLALRYAGQHAGRLPAVLGARLLRTWSLYPLSPAEQVRWNTYIDRRVTALEWASLITAWAAMLLSALALRDLRARRAPLVPLVAPIVLVSVVSLLFYGDERFRDAADVSLVVLGTFGAAALAARVRARRPARPSTLEPPAAPVRRVLMPSEED